MGECFRFNRNCGGKAVPLPDNYHKLINTKFFSFHIVRGRMRQRDAKLKTAIGDRVLDLPRIVNLKIQRNFGVLQPKLSQRLRQNVLSSNYDASQIEASDNHFPQLGARAFRGGDSLEQIIGMAIEKDTRFCQVYPPSNPAEKCDPEFSL